MKYSRILLIALLTLPLLFSCKDQVDPPPAEICGNGIDDDGDGFVDYEDFDCTETGDECNNGIDDDGDGFIDNDDLDCTETGDECNNGIDDDGDGFIDNEDFDCQ
jgi:hypothetical protein